MFTYKVLSAGLNGVIGRIDGYRFIAGDECAAQMGGRRLVEGTKRKYLTGLQGDGIGAGGRILQGSDTSSNGNGSIGFGSYHLDRRMTIAIAARALHGNEEMEAQGVGSL